MPLIALLDGTTRVDATDPDDRLWCAVWRVRPRRDLTCRECGARLDAVDRAGTRFFRHHRHVDCASVDESPEHLRLKALVAAAVRAHGWDAQLEEPVPPRRADVLAVGPDGRRVALEVQLSPQHADDTRDRIADYAAAGVDTIWLVQDPFRLGDAHNDVRRLVLDRADRVTAPLKRARTEQSSAWDGRTHRPITAVTWQQVGKTVELAAMLAAVFDGRVVWSPAAGGWTPATELNRYDLLAEQEAAARAEAAVALQALQGAQQEERDRTLAAAAAGDPVGYATARRVADGLLAAGHPTPRIVKGGKAVAHGWVVRTETARVVVDPDPAHLGVWLRDRRTWRRFFVRHEINDGVTVASPDRHDGLAADLLRVHHIDTWAPEPALLPSPDGEPVGRDHLEAARRVVARLSEAFGARHPHAAWVEDDQAWVWTLPDLTTVALARATSPDTVATATGTHRVVLHLNRHVLPRDTDRRLIWRNLTVDHLTADLTA